MLNYVDVILLIIFLIIAYHGYRRGFIIGLFELLALAASIVLGFASYPYIATFVDQYFHLQERWLFPMSFIIGVMIARLVIGLLVLLILKNISNKTHQQSFNRIMGLIPGAIKGLFIVSLLSVVFLFFPFWPELPDKARQSFTANYLSQGIELADRNIAPDITEKVKQSISKLTIEPESEETIFLHYKVDNGNVNEKFENHLLVLVNEERKKRGLKVLARDTALRLVAREHSIDMFKKGYFSHINLEGKSPFDRIKAHNITYLTAGENLALAQTVEIAHMGLMNSPGHKANILNPKFGRVGIGIIDGGIYGLMVTQNFRD